MNAEQLSAYRKRIEDALRQSGYPLDQWKADVEKDLALNPKSRPATRIVEGYTQGRKLVRPGYQEFRAHGRHAGVMVPRCLAKAHHGAQCGSIAMRSSFHCARHGGRRPGQHRKGQDHHWFEGKNEARAQRQHRKKSHEELKKIEALAIQQGVIEVTIDSYLKGRERRLKLKRLNVRKAQPV